MTGLILAGMAALIVLLLAFHLLFRRRGRTPPRPAYRKRDFLLCQEERSLFAALKRAVGEEYEIFGGIRVQEVLVPRSGSGRNDPDEEFEALEAERLAFVLCRRADLSIACAVQLRESGLVARKTQEPGEPLETLCREAGLPLVVFRAAPDYAAGELREAIATAIRKEPLYLTEPDGRKEPRISGLENLEL